MGPGTKGRCARNMIIFTTVYQACPLHMSAPYPHTSTYSTNYCGRYITFLLWFSFQVTFTETLLLWFIWWSLQGRLHSTDNISSLIILKHHQRIQFDLRHWWDGFKGNVCFRQSNQYLPLVLSLSNLLRGSYYICMHTYRHKILNTKVG